MLTNVSGAGGYAGSGGCANFYCMDAGNGGGGGYGGGIASHAGALSLIGSTVAGNSSGDGRDMQDSVSNGGNGGNGGGLHSQSPLILVATTVSGNSTGRGGQGGHGGNDYYGNYPARGGDGGAAGRGGGIQVAAGTVTMTNVTVSANRASSGGVGGLGGTGVDGAIAPPGNGGAAGTGGGIANLDTATVEAQDTIFAGNLAIGTGPDCQGTVRSNGHNLIRASSGCTILGATATDLIDVDELLGPLQVNPPGTTATHALLFGSIAIDAGSCGGGSVTVDQRGVSRPRGSACDIGAYEFDLTAWWLRWFPEILRD